MKEKFSIQREKKLKKKKKKKKKKNPNKQMTNKQTNKGIIMKSVEEEDPKNEEERSLGSITNHQSTLIIIVEGVDSDHQGPTKRRRCPRLPPQLSRTAHLPPPPLYNQSSAPRRESRTFLYTSSRKENQCQKFSIERRTRSRPVFPMPPVECKRT